MWQLEQIIRSSLETHSWNKQAAFLGRRRNRSGKLGEEYPQGGGQLRHHHFSVLLQVMVGLQRTRTELTTSVHQPQDPDTWMHSPHDCALALMQMLPSATKQKAYSQHQLSSSPNRTPPGSEPCRGVPTDRPGRPRNKSVDELVKGGRSSEQLTEASLSLPGCARLRLRSADAAAMKSSRRSICNRARREDRVQSSEFRVQA